MKNFVLFGASGDLAIKKIYPSIYLNYKDGLDCKYIGYGRTDLSDSSFRGIIKDSIQKDDKRFLDKFSYIQGSYDPNGLKKLSKEIGDFEDLIYYFSLPNRLDIVKKLVIGLKENNLITKSSLFVIEKPLGDSYPSAKELIDFLDENIGKENIFLIDHYLSKDLVRNLISIRFSNPIFENLWSSKYIERIEIEISEDIGIGNRGRYYDSSGAIRDMIQSHGLQLLSLITIEQPEVFDTENFHLEKEKILKRVISFKRGIKVGQYNGYRDEEFVKDNSLTETYASIDFEIDSDRWRGTSINISTGKRLDKKKTEVRIYFRSMDRCLWQNYCKEVTTNILTINIYPKNDISLTINGRFDPKELPQRKDLTFSFDKEGLIRSPYSNALRDVYKRERIYTPSSNEVLYSWKIVDGIEEWLKDKRKDLLEIY
jgi:glucose-6-phosphate 1-dehydrogenase